MIRTRVFLAITALGLLLGGCASAPKSQVVERPAEDPAKKALAEAVKHVQRSWNMLAVLDQARDPELGGEVDDIDYLEYPELGRSIYFPWDGEIYPAVESLAAYLGYEAIEVGRRPINPIYVHAPGLAMMPIGDVLRDLSAQAGRRATVVLKPNWKRIEVVYTPEYELIEGGR